MPARVDACTSARFVKTDPNAMKKGRNVQRSSFNHWLRPPSAARAGSLIAGACWLLTACSGGTIEGVEPSESGGTESLGGSGNAAAGGGPAAGAGGKTSQGGQTQGKGGDSGTGSSASSGGNSGGSSGSPGSGGTVGE